MKKLLLIVKRIDPVHLLLLTLENHAINSEAIVAHITFNNDFYLVMNIGQVVPNSGQP